MTSGTLHVEHIRMELATIFQEVDRLGGTRVGTEGEGHLASQSAIGIAFRAAKRSFDIAASVVGMVVLSPLLLATAVAVKFTSQGPVIFKQKRYGKDEVPFTCYKFRTMKIDTPPNIPTRVMREDKAVMTPIGAMLRKTSIDELPQLVNIVKGDMSVVGPQPTTDIPLPMFARHPHRCSGRLGVSERARPYSASIQPSSLSLSVSANWEISCGGDGSVSGRGAPLPIGAIRHLLD